MKNALKLTTTLLLLSCWGALAETEEQINKQFTVEPGGMLIVEVDFGSINIRTNGSGKVKVDVWRKIGRRTKADEEKFLRENPIIFSQDGNTITIRCRKKASKLRSLLSGKNSNEAKYMITAPAAFSAELKTAGGGISVQDLSGKVTASTSGGPLDFARLRGPLDGGTSGGAVNVADCEGTLKVHTSGGGIQVTGGSGEVESHTSGGASTVKNFRGPAQVETSGGGITIVNVTGAIEGSTSGGSISLDLSTPLSGKIKLSTSGGGVTARLPVDAAFDLDAETSGGGVSSEFSVATDGIPGRGRLNGKVNDGGKPVVLRTSGGDIHVGKNQIPR